MKRQYVLNVMKGILFTLLWTFSLSIFAQNITVHGTVKDENGEPLIGATIMVQGTSIGTVTDMDGNYTLLNVPRDGKLVVSYVGMETQVIDVNGRTSINVVLKESPETLEEVVVIGYGTIKKRDLTGAVSSVKSEEIRLAPVANPMEALQGLVAGLDVTRSSGRSGSSPEVLLRGNRSLTASSAPLYIIDGIPGSISALSIDDIESIEVLKDASSTAIYGSAGANGVIIVTTKRAEKGKIQVDVNAFTGINAFASFPKALMGDEWLDYLKAGYYGAYGNYPANRNDLLTAYSMSPEQLNPYIDAGKWVDWVDETLHTGMQQNYHVSLRGGTERTQGYFSLGYNSEKGIYKNDKTETYTLRTGVNHEINDVVETGIQSYFTWRDRNSRSSRVNKAFSTIPLGDVYDTEGKINIEPIAGHSTVSLIADDVPGVYKNNPKQLYVNANPYIEFKPIKGLSIKSILGVSINSNRTGIFESDKSYMNLVGSGSQKKTAQYNTGLGYGYTWNNIANYQFQVNSDHNFILTGITEWSDSRNESSSAYNEGFDYDEFTYYNLAAGNNPKTSSGFSQTKKMSYAARLNYSYKGRYLLTLSNRWDGASQLVDKWDSFPAVALGWRISDETFMENTASWLTNLKLRVGYGVSGNSNISPYSSMTMVESSPIQMVLGSSQVPIYVPTQAVGNAALKWEKTYSTNVGIDVGLLKNRIDLTLDWYYTDTKDVLYNRPLPSAFGAYDAKNYYTMMSNIARMTNQGVEMTINSRNIVNGPFKWNSTINFAMNNEKVKSIDLGADIQVQDLIALNLFLGEPKNTVYGYKKLGIWQADEAEEAALYGRKPGEIKIQTVPKIDENGRSDEGVHAYSADDRQILGAESPDWTLGFLNNFSWKNWDMSLLFTARWGQVVNAPILGYFKYGQPNLPAFYDYWTPENPTNDFPQPNILGNKDDVALASLSIVDGSFVKIKNITLGYTFPESLAKRMRISRLRFYSTINNPFIFAKSHLFKEVDPETKGSDEFPLYKQVVFGINLSF